MASTALPTLPAPTPLAVEPLTAEAFAPFGQVIEAGGSARHWPINAGLAERWHDLAAIDTQAEGGRPLLNLFRAQGQALPLAITLLERHQLGSQAFLPIALQAFLVVVAPPGPVPDEARLRAFLAAPGQGVNYGRGTWHHPLIALGDGGDFWVIDRGGPAAAEDCEVVSLAAPRKITRLA